MKSCVYPNHMHNTDIMKTQTQFKPYQPNQLLLLPPDMKQWLRRRRFILSSNCHGPLARHAFGQDEFDGMPHCLVHLLSAWRYGTSAYAPGPSCCELAYVIF